MMRCAKAIILASRSRARQELLKKLGLEFRVIPSAAKENAVFRKSCAAFTIANAREKARDVASGLSAGVVIAADTVVLCRGRIAGKPQDRAEAREMIKMFCRYPQWVYTGLAVIDAGRWQGNFADKTGKSSRKAALTDYQKTKVYLRPMTDAQIEVLLDNTVYRDRAGGFDIQGAGAAFVRRIEGCFYNVVGLPLSSLAAILERMGVMTFSQKVKLTSTVQPQMSTY